MRPANGKTRADFHKMFTIRPLSTQDAVAYSERREHHMRIRGIALLLGCAGLALAQAPSVSNGGVLNGASFAKGQPVTPGSLVSIFGTNLASQTAQADTIPLSKSLGGVTVQFVKGATTVNAPILFVQPDDPANKVSSQLNVQVPWEIVPAGSTANVTVVVTNNKAVSAPAEVMIGPFSPGVFTSNGLAIAVNNSDGTLAWPAGTVPGLTTHPAKMGDTIIVYATGLGAVANPPVDGQNSLDKLRPTLVTPQVLIGGVSAQVSFSGLSPQFVGVNQVNVTIPNVAPGNGVPLQFMLGGITTAAGTTIAVSQ
jgi:uncharacterized protein (TIGR03437 family)